MLRKPWGQPVLSLFRILVWGSVFIGFAGDRTLAHPPQPQSSEPSHGSSLGHGSSHSHGAIEIPKGMPVPTVRLIVRPDSIRGWNINVQVSNFRFAPERVNQSSLPNEGHAHLFINGKKTTRLYGSWYFLPSLPPGQHTIAVTLNTNRHEDLLHNGQPIQASVTLTVPSTER